MEVREHLRQALDSLTEHPRRVLASSTGVFWGAAAIVLLLSWGTGFREYMKLELSRFGRGTVFLVPGVTSSGFPGYRAGRSLEISREDLRVAEGENTDWVEALLPHHESRERMLVEAPGGRLQRLDLSGSGGRFLDLRNFEIEHGRAFSPREAERGLPMAVLGPEAAEDLFGTPAAAVGGTIRIEGRSFEVVGVPRSKGRQYMNTHRPDNRLLVVPAVAAEDRLGFRKEVVGSIMLFLRPGVAAEDAVRAVFRTLGPRAGFHPEDYDAVKWFDTTRFLGLVDLFYAGFMIFVGLAGTITLLIGGIGIANYHLATLAERTTEIGLAKALGARNRTVVAQTVLESLLVSASTALLGVLFGVGVCAVMTALTPEGALPTPILSPLAAVVTFAALLGVALVAALIPALRVRHIEVAAALRAET